eukprot:365365-Chlamydomonas_euryale.AAC.14
MPTPAPRPGVRAKGSEESIYNVAGLSALEGPVKPVVRTFHVEVPDAVGADQRKAGPRPGLPAATSRTAADSSQVRGGVAIRHGEGKG